MNEESEKSLDGEALRGRAIRIGDTVRKPAGPWTPTIRSLLEHLERKQFPAPRFLGVDGEGREILSYVHGEASNWPWPAILRSPAGAERVGRTLRRYHDDVSDFLPPAPCFWQQEEPRQPVEGEIACHGDFGPYNLVWRDDEIVGVIDWEWARPAPPMRDIAYAAWMCVPFRADAELDGWDLKCCRTGDGDYVPFATATAPTRIL